MKSERKPYWEKLKDQRWQKKRLELLENAGWRCQSAYCDNNDLHAELQVHHRLYLRNTEPWDYPDWAYRVLCDDCHKIEQRIQESAHEALAKSEQLMFACATLNKMDSDVANEFIEVIGHVMTFKTLVHPWLKVVTPVIDVLSESLMDGMKAQAAVETAANAEKSEGGT